MKLRLATRASDLALWQARHVASRIRVHAPETDVELITVTTTGDRNRDTPLARIGDVGLFTRQVDQTVLAGGADIAVHSLKDVPTVATPGLVIGAILEREDPRDAFLPAPGRPPRLLELPAGARIGTSSLRRRALVAALRPDVIVEDLRGNLDTRLRRLAAADYDAIIVALAGLVRLGRIDCVGEPLDPTDWLPAVGQGALAVVIREQDDRVRACVAPLDHARTRTAVTAERAFLNALEGGCQVPIGALATSGDNGITIDGFVSALGGAPLLRGSASGPTLAPANLGKRLAADLLSLGAGAILEAIRAQVDAPGVSAP